MWVVKFFWVRKKKFGWTIFCVARKKKIWLGIFFDPEKNVGRENFWVGNFFWFGKIFGSGNFLGQEICLGPAICFGW